METDATYIHTTPRQAQTYLTIACFEGQRARSLPHLTEASWPEQEKGWLMANLMGLMMSLPAITVVFFVFPWLIFAFGWLKEHVGTPRRWAGWQDKLAEAYSGDLLYQCVSRLAASPLAEVPIAIAMMQADEEKGGGWILRVAQGHGVELEVRFSTANGETITTEMSLTLARSSGASLKLPEGWPGLEEARCWQKTPTNATVEITTALTALHHPTRAAPEADEDLAVALSDALAVILEANGLDLKGPQSALGASIRLVPRSPHDTEPLPDVESPRRASLVVGPALEGPRIASALWALKGWGVETLLRNALFVSMFFIGMALLFIVTGILHPERLPMSINITMASVMLFSFVTTLPMFLPLPARRQVRTAPSPQTPLQWRDGILSLGEDRLSLAQPFIAQLSRSSEGGSERWLNVVLQQRDKARRLRFRVGLSPEAEVDVLPQLDTRYAIIEAADFEAWVWPLIQTFARIHGDPIPWGPLTSRDTLSQRGVEVSEEVGVGSVSGGFG